MRAFLYIFIFTSLAFQTLAQTDDVYTGSSAPSDTTKRKQHKDREWLKKLTYEGNLQFQFGAYSFVYFSPTIGYSPVKKLNVGLGVIYSYGTVSQSVFGGHSYARYFINDIFFLQGQYDKLRQPNVYSFSGEKMKWVDYVFAGGGFRKPVGDKVALSATVLFNLTPSPLSIYPNRLILQIGFMGSF